MTESALCFCAVAAQGRFCVVAAQGRCADCGRAYCPSHAAPPSSGPQDQCTDCRQAAVSRAEERRARALAAEEPVREARVAAAEGFLGAMTAAGSPGVAAWRAESPDVPVGTVAGWLLEGWAHEAAASDARGDRGHATRNIVLTTGHIGVARDEARTMWEAYALFRPDEEVARHFRRPLDRRARAYRRYRRRPLVVTRLVPFADLRLDVGSGYVDRLLSGPGGFVFGVHRDLGPLLAGAARAHGVAWQP
ncbi:hypothetical protein [Kitasatospora sp. KL5]|uniref:hypothetical protein n=1 Tax=Kitasatospora sp. KL5 TaxID=3425125 RepID=UPI003D6DF205